jgi:hypothetical protein
LLHNACLESSLGVGNETVIAMTAILGYARVITGKTSTRSSQR